MPFGGLLGSTFAFVFETQLEALQNGDRFYYLSRTAGLDFGVALENNSFAQLIMLNTDATHLPGDVFTTPAYTLEVDPTKQFNANVANGPGADSILFDNPLTVLDESADNIATPRQDPLGPDSLIPLVIRDDAQTPHVDTNYLRYTGAGHVVLGGTNGRRQDHLGHRRRHALRRRRRRPAGRRRRQRSDFRRRGRRHHHRRRRATTSSMATRATTSSTAATA